MKTMGSVARGLWPLLAILVCAPAAADLRSAQEAYQKGDFTKAAKDFRELAELGQPLAQYDLAIMYARGEGVRHSDIYAYAWASLAADNGMDTAHAMVEKLRPNLAPGSEQIAAQIKEQFGNAQLDSRLNPKLIEDAEQEDRSRCRVVKLGDAHYPPEAVAKGIQGGIYTEYSVMADGRSRNPRILYALPQKVFDREVRKALLHTQFTAGEPNAPPTQCTTFFHFKMGQLSVHEYPKLQDLVRQTQMRAEGGDPESQMLYGMLLAGLPQLKTPHSKALPWFLKAAQAGVPSAQYQVGFSLLKGWSCNCEENKGLDWLRRAAQSGQPDAEVTLAMYALKGNPDAERYRQAKLWLEQATTSGNHDGKLYLSALLATAPAADGGDPKRALNLIDELFEGIDDDPAAHEIRAAALANDGHFQAAAYNQREAIKRARRLKWDLAPLNERLAAYNASQPWRGPLLNF